MIYYEVKTELTFKLNEDYSILATYEVINKNGKHIYDVSLWLADTSKYSCGYKKYIYGEDIESKSNSIRDKIKTLVNKMYNTKAFDTYISDYEEEINCIGEMYLMKENERMMH